MTQVLLACGIRSAAGTCTCIMLGSSHARCLTVLSFAFVTDEPQWFVDTSRPQTTRVTVKGTRDQQKRIRDATCESVTPERINHSVVARMLGRPDAKAHLAQAHAQVSPQQSPAHDEVSEQLSPLENLALDADTKVW